MRLGLRSVAVAFLVGAAVLAAQPQAFKPVTDEVLQKPTPSDWLNWRRTLDGWGYSPLDAINRSNVKTLKLVWSWTLDPGPSQIVPLVYDGVMYLTNPGNVVQALDAATGDLRWEYRRQNVNPRAQMRSLAIYQDLVLLATVDAHIAALDARTGAVRWDTPLGGNAVGLTFTSGPIVADGAVIAGMTGCAGFDDDTCYVVAVDGRTGKQLWRASTVARPGEPGGDTWGSLPLKARAGGDAWIPGSYDPINKLVYWGTSQAKPWARRVRGDESDELYTNSTLALDPKTGAVRWFFQHLPGDSYDMDETFERILIDHDGRSSVFSMGKLGILWELNRTNGQFVRATDSGYQNQVDVDERTGKVRLRPEMVQTPGQEILFCPTTGGAKTFRAMAYHPQTAALYVPYNIACETATFLPKPAEQNTRTNSDGAVLRGGLVKVGRHSFNPKSPDQMGELRAITVRDGRTRWSQRRRAPYNTAALTTAGGLVFVGAWDRFVFGYDAADGTLLWQTRLPAMANGFPITYAAGGRQYLAVGVGSTLNGSTWAELSPAALAPELRNPRTASNAIFVFALAGE